MSVNEELSEHAEHAKAPFDKKVAVTMAVIAAALAVDGVLAHMLTTEELLLQQKASDQWAYYQAKSIRRYDSELARDIFKAFNHEAAAKSSEVYAKNVEKYKKDMDDITDQAHEFEHESHLKGLKAHSLEYGEVFLEIGIVFASLAILTKRNLIWFVSMGSAAVGAVIALSALWVKLPPETLNP